jgi:hypothetical protein
MSAVTTYYDQDFYAWLVHQVELLRQRRLSELDIDNLIEEIDGLSKAQRQQIVNRLAVLIMHLLKWQFVSHQRSKSWRFTIKEQRERIRLLLQDSPSLRYQLADKLVDAYGLAVLKAIKEAPQDEGKFPETCPFSLTQLLDDQFYPD